MVNWQSPDQGNGNGNGGPQEGVTPGNEPSPQFPPFDLPDLDEGPDASPRTPQGYSYSPYPVEPPDASTIAPHAGVARVQERGRQVAGTVIARAASVQRVSSAAGKWTRGLGDVIYRGGALLAWTGATIYAAGLTWIHSGPMWSTLAKGASNFPDGLATLGHVMSGVTPIIPVLTTGTLLFFGTREVLGSLRASFIKSWRVFNNEDPNGCDPYEECHDPGAASPHQPAAPAVPMPPPADGGRAARMEELRRRLNPGGDDTGGN